MRRAPIKTIVHRSFLGLCLFLAAMCAAAWISSRFATDSFTRQFPRSDGTRRDILFVIADGSLLFSHTIMQPALVRSVEPYWKHIRWRALPNFNEGRARTFWNRLGFTFRRVNGRNVERLFVGVPFWFLCGLCLAFPIGLYLPRQIKRLVRQRPGLCPSCGYDLRATPDRCPECGALVPIAASA